MTKRLSTPPVQAGQVFGNWTILAFDQTKDRHNGMARCVCGLTKKVRVRNLLLGISTRCHQCRQRLAAAGRTSHGETKSIEYSAWLNMKARCYRPSSTEYHRYGARGIAVCQRWLDSFEHFLADMGKRPSPRHSIDRIDVNGNYCPENCRWATAHEQARNTRQNHFITFRGETLCMKDWALRLGIEYNTLSVRLQRGMPVERALTMPTKRKREA